MAFLVDFYFCAKASGAVALAVRATNKARASGLARDIVQSVWETAGSLTSQPPPDAQLRERNGKQAAEWPRKAKARRKAGLSGWYRAGADYQITTRSAQTNVRMKDGDTLVIGGLISSSDTKNMSKVPILGDLPMLGKLFQSVTRGKIETEVVIFLKAKIVKQ